MAEGRSLRRTVACAALFALLVACTGNPSAGRPAPLPSLSPSSPGPRPTPLTVKACPGLRHVRCGSIVVPLYRSRPPDPATDLRIAFRIYPHTDRSTPPQEPLVAFEGGPGYPSIGSATSYRFLMGPLRRHRDLILMDQRGTGASGAIDCPALQRGVGNYTDLVARCARTLGDAANAYGSAAAAHDLHAILQGLGIASVNLYGDSYGTYLAQVFALHHPEDVRAMVLDGAYDQSFDPFARDASAALRRAWRDLCEEAGTCPGILGTFGRFARRLAAHPLTGFVRGPGGEAHRVRLTADGFAQLVYDATYVFTIYRDLPAAIRSLEQGDAAPMLRLVSEDLSSTSAGGDPRYYSEGLYMAVSCHDYPTIWDPAADVATRRVQLADAIDALSRHAFAPFRLDAWLDSLYEHQLVYGCLKWPSPAIPDPAFPPDLARSTVPTLVLNGELDVTTPLVDARRIALAWPNSTLVEVRNELHVAALYDFHDCASVIARRFIQTLEAGETSCAGRIPQVEVMPSFPVRSGQAPESTPEQGLDRSTAADRRAAWVAAQTVGDAFTRWYNVLYSGTGAALRGGTFTMRGPYLGHRPLTIELRRARLVEDLAVSGRATWNRRAFEVGATVRLEGVVSGVLRIRFPTQGEAVTARLTGMLDGRPIRVSMPAPWAP